MPPTPIPHRPARRRLVVALVLAAALGGAGCGGGEDADGAAPSAPQTTATDPAADTATSAAPDEGAADGPAPIVAEVAGTFEEPIALEVRPGDDHLWLAERAGTVRRVAVAADGSLAADGDPVLDLTDQTTTEAERGLLDLAFSADGAVLYVSRTNLDGNTRLTAYDLDGDDVDLGSERELLAVDQPYPNHNGGNVVLGPDGAVWFGLGDGGAADDPENRAQDPDTVLGKIVRLAPDGGDPEIVVTGVRNPWRFAFDDDGSLWIGDVGQNAWEEVDHLPADAIDGANLGWSGYEGTHPYLDGDGRRPADAVGPVFEYPHDGGACSITGGFPYRGTVLAGLDGWYLFADYCVGRIRAIHLAADGSFAGEADLGVDVGSPISFAADADGEPLVLSQDGDIVRLRPAS